MKNKETLEEVAEKTADNFEEPNFKAGVIYGVIEGAKWQQKRMYSEEEVHKIIGSYSAHKTAFDVNFTYDRWFKQFKKK